MQLLAYREIGFDDLAHIWPQIGRLGAEVREQVEIHSAYAGYLGRQDADVEAFRRDEALALPAELDYAAVGGFPPRRGKSSPTLRLGHPRPGPRIEGRHPRRAYRPVRPCPPPPRRLSRRPLATTLRPRPFKGRPALPRPRWPILGPSEPCWPIGTAE